MGTADDLRALLDCITRHPAAILRLPDRGLAPGGRADLVVWECERVEEIVAALARQALVVKAGRVTVEHEHRLRARWREGEGAGGDSR
jgi:imidazolonepropionase-like amidohydrolase